MTQEVNAIIQKKMIILLEEAFENVHGYFLSKNTSILETLKSINSNVASRLFENGKETIVGHVKHTLLALKYSQDYLKKNDLSKYEWNKDWKDTVNDNEWTVLINELNLEYCAIKLFMEGIHNMIEGNNLDIIVGSIAHCAYHLAIIRQHIE